MFSTSPYHSWKYSLPDGDCSRLELTRRTNPSGSVGGSNVAFGVLLANSGAAGASESGPLSVSTGCAPPVEAPAPPLPAVAAVPLAPPALLEPAFPPLPPAPTTPAAPPVLTP